MNQLSLNKTYLNLKSFYYIPSTPLNLRPFPITPLSTKSKQPSTNKADLSTTPPKIQTPTNRSCKHSASTRIKRNLLIRYSPSPLSPNNSNTTAFKYRKKFTKSKHKTITISTNPTNAISSNYKRFLFPLSLSTSTLKRKNKHNVTPDTTNATSTYIDNNNNTVLKQQTNKSASSNHSRNTITNNSNRTKYLKTSYSYILSKENEVSVQKHFRRKFYDETHHTFYNALRTQKNQFKLSERNCLDDNYIQKQKNKPQVVLSYMVYRPNGMLNIVNKEKGDLIKYSDSFMKLKDVEFYKKSNQIVNQYQTYRVNAKVKDSDVKRIVVPKKNVRTYKTNTIQTKYEVIKRDYIKLQHRFKEYLNKSAKVFKYK